MLLREGSISLLCAGPSPKTLGWNVSVVGRWRVKRRWHCRITPWFCWTAQGVARFDVDADSWRGVAHSLPVDSHSHPLCLGMSTTTPMPIYVLALTLLVSSIARIVMVVWTIIPVIRAILIVLKRQWCGLLRGRYRWSHKGPAAEELLDC